MLSIDNLLLEFNIEITLLIRLNPAISLSNLTASPRLILSLTSFDILGPVPDINTVNFSQISNLIFKLFFFVLQI